MRSISGAKPPRTIELDLELVLDLVPATVLLLVLTYDQLTRCYGYAYAFYPTSVHYPPKS